MWRRAVVLVGLGMVAASCDGTGLPVPGSSGSSGANGVAGSGAAGSTGSTGSECTADYSGAGLSMFTSGIGSCVNFNATCGGIVCTTVLGTANQAFYLSDKASFLIEYCPGMDDGGMGWYEGNEDCSQLINDLVGGCETSEEAPGSNLSGTDSWYSAGGDSCFSCDQCAPSMATICIKPITLNTSYACGPVHVNVQPTSSTGGAGGSGHPLSSSSSSGTTGGALTSSSSGAAAGTSSSSSGSATNPVCTGTLVGGPIAGTATFACAATGALSSGVGIELQVQASTVVQSDGGWGTAGLSLAVADVNATTVAPGTYAAGDGGSWQAVYVDPAGNSYGSFFGGQGAVSFTISSVDANDDLSGTASVIVPACPNGTTCDGGSMTATYRFSY